MLQAMRYFNWPNILELFVSRLTSVIRSTFNTMPIQMRAASQIRYRTSGGQAFAAVICDSGPLANTAHHPAWGRIAETYGEDPYLVKLTQRRPHKQFKDVGDQMFAALTCANENRVRRDLSAYSMRSLAQA
jgi:hypothetical protein